jgi:hypothetical protein
MVDFANIVEKRGNTYIKLFLLIIFCISIVIANLRGNRKTVNIGYKAHSEDKPNENTEHRT